MNVNSFSCNSVQLTLLYIIGFVVWKVQIVLSHIFPFFFSWFEL